MDTELRSDATGFCAQCMNQVSARVVQRDSDVFIIKSCPTHGDSEAKIERDAELYKLMSFDPGKEVSKEIASVIISVTHRCNIHCRFCYLPDEAPPDPSREYLLNACKDINLPVLLGGREPTMRDDLPQLISDLKQNGKIVGLITNGIQLANEDYVRSLEEAGLDMVILSLDSLKDSYYESYEGHRHLNRKLAALENLSKTKMEISISSTITPDVNDDELGDLWQKCLEYRESITAFRVRTSAEVGRSTEINNYFLSDIMDKLAEGMGTTRAELLSGYDRELCYHSALVYRGDAYLTANSSQVSLDYVDGAPIWWQKENNGITPPVGDLMISLFISSWPDRDTINLQEPCTVGHYVDEETILPFFEACVRNGHDIDL